jgi:gliding motility-associated-like protein
MYTFYIPNTFTPNDDGINETFTGTGIGIKAYKMWIYDRWGEKLYYTEDINKGWDASVKGVHNVEKMDVYTYKAVVTDLWNKDHEYVGHVTLLK